MNYNVLTYCIYLPIISFIMIKVGHLFYMHGELFLLNLFNQNKSLVKSINNILLIGYYLINLGYAIITISYWDQLHSVLDIINSMSDTLGKIIMILSALHFNNIFCLTYFIKSKSVKQ